MTYVLLKFFKIRYHGNAIDIK